VIVKLGLLREEQNIRYGLTVETHTMKVSKVCVLYNLLVVKDIAI
jgi:hypothetical protein